MKRKPIISDNIRLRYPDSFEAQEGAIIDDFCYFSTRVKIGRYSHVASSCSVAGGKQGLFVLGDYSSLSSGVKVWCSSNDFTRDMVTIIPDGFDDVQHHAIYGDVIMDRLTGVGANSVIMPNNHLPEGVVIGALSFVPTEYKFEPWMVYAGVPLRPVKSRDRESVLKQMREFEEALARQAEKPGQRTVKSWA